MRKIFAMTLVTLCLAACGSHAPKASTSDVDSTVVETVDSLAVADSVVVVDTLVVE